jgi:hypothetical protein
MISKSSVKRILGEIPLTAELYWQFRQSGRPLSESFSLQRTQEWLPRWRAEAETAVKRFPPGKRVLLFATLRYWIEHAVLLGLALGGQGHQVSLAHLPYANWRKPVDRFDMRRQIAYSQKILGQSGPLLKSVLLMDTQDRSVPDKLPSELLTAIETVSIRDVQYTFQVEDIDLEDELYHLRLERNKQAARSALAHLRQIRPEVVVTPNGSILEFGAVYQAARYLGIPVVTYEFGEQRGRIWLAQNGEVMRQETDSLWQARQDAPLSDEQIEWARALYTSRQRADLWQNFSRRWQGQPSQGEAKVRATVGLDSRPIVLLAANVIGDSLTLGRQVFTDTMTEWLQRTVLYFSSRPDVQLVVRIHPGERYTNGPSVEDVVRQVLLEPPEHIHLVAADDLINTYDLIEIADFGLVYTTTVGMEMAMSGVPVAVAGQTHYRGRGFTLDPDSWQDYQELLELCLSDPGLANPSLASPGTYRLSRQQVDRAWNYAYRFFFEYPQPFPWHLLHFWDELQDWPVGRVLGEEGQAIFGNTFRYLTGEPIDWGACELEAWS